MTDRLVIVGAGGFGRETIDVVRAINAAAPEPLWELVGVVDDAPSDLNISRLEALGVPFLGGIESLVAMPGTAVTIGVGSPRARAAISGRTDDWGLISPNLVHPTAVIGSQFETQHGLVVGAHVSIGTNVELGRHVHLNPHAVIGHDAALADFVSVNPNATVSGECAISSGSLIGAGSVVLQGVSVGVDSIVGASACVTKTMGSKSILAGVPARPLESAGDHS